VKADRRITDIPPLILGFGTRCRRVVNFMPQPL